MNKAVGNTAGVVGAQRQVLGNMNKAVGNTIGVVVAVGVVGINTAVGVVRAQRQVPSKMNGTLENVRVGKGIVAGITRRGTTVS